MPQEVYASLLAQLPSEDDENDDVEEEGHEGTPAESADGGQAEGDCLAFASDAMLFMCTLP